MKKYILLFSLACLPFLVSAQDLPRHKKPKETKDLNVFDITKNQGTVLEYHTPKEVREKFEKEAKLQMYSPEVRSEKESEMPKGGKLLLLINRLTIGSADTKYFTIVIQTPQGQEIFREEFDSSVASPVHGPVTYWRNLALSYLPEPIPDNSIAYVIDRLGEKRYEYLLRNNE